MRTWCRQQYARQSGSRCQAQAQTAQTAEIWLWDTATWAPAGRLAAHGLTVTQLAFSADGRYIASASRDRSFAVFAEAAPGAAGEICTVHGALADLQSCHHLWS